MVKPLIRTDLKGFNSEQFEEVVMLGVKNDNITVVSSCKSPELTTAILECAVHHSLVDIFPHLRDGYVH